MGVITPGEVASLAESILSDPERSRAIRLDLLQAMGQPGAAARTVEAIREVLDRSGEHMTGASAGAAAVPPDAEE
ncbi:hypothetical protein D3C86_1988990 [compost metagenome]